MYARRQNKANKVECAPIVDSDHPGRPLSLITVFDVPMELAYTLI